MTALLPNLPVAAILALIGVIAGVALTYYAARRTVRQPLDLAVADEVTVLVGVLAEVKRLPYLTALSATDFAAGAHARIWEALTAIAAAELAELPEEPTEDDCARVGDLLDARYHEVHEELTRRLAAGAHRAGDLTRLTYLSEQSAQHAPTDDQVVEAASNVLLTGTDRVRLAGAGLVLATATPDSIDPDLPPIHRVHQYPTRLRRVLTGAATGVGAALTYGFAVSAGLSGAALWLAVAALLVLLAGSVVLALVDQDTFYVDLRTMLWTIVGSWGLTAAAVGVAGQWSRLVVGVIVVAAVAVFFDLANRAYRAVRGIDGQGFGDTLIIIATIGVPAALTGDWMLGYASGLAGMVLVLGGWSIMAAQGKVTRSTPVAFGPYLAAGWVAGWAVSLLAG